MNPFALALPEKEKERLVKLMQLTLSDNDNEALRALRKATKILDRNHLNWDQVLNLIDVKKIIAFENDQGGLTFRPHATAFDQDLNEAEAERRLAARERAKLPDVIISK